MEQNEGLGNKSTKLRRLMFDKVGKTCSRKKKLQRAWEKLDIHLMKNEARFTSFALYKNQFKMGERPSLKLLEETTGSTF